MKIGKEVEGKHLGKKTLFLQAEEYLKYRHKFIPFIEKEAIFQIYISDHNSLIDSNECFNSILYEYSDLLITLEVKKIPDWYTPSVEFILAIELDPRELGLYDTLKSSIQIKFTKDLHVATIPVDNLVITEPFAFNDDIDITEEDLNV